ncbi:MAG: bifunctional phosphoglucose/phosphomannose isomerase [Chloroflexi bacterium]|nr:bifunctional phosphoglucose/phosphomannose isomerase [Chloroflexota bacterium]
MSLHHTLLLDDPQTYAQLDPTGLRNRIGDLPRQCFKAWRQGRDFALPLGYGSSRHIVIAGMGGSAIGGDLLADLVSMEKALPIAVCRDYILPPHVGRDSLVIASSLSGNTEETLSACLDALDRGARVVAMTAGGRLGQMARETGIPQLCIDYTGEPRTALGYSFLVPLAILQGLGLIEPKDEQIEEALEVLAFLVRRLGPGVPHEENPAKDLAATLQGKLVVLYGAGHLSGVARRWKAQLNENAKTWAFVETLPEADHNAVAGIQWPQSVTKKACIVLLNALGLHPRVRLRYRPTVELLKKAGVECRTVDGVGKGALSQMLSAVLFGDYTSYYLALLNGEDPSPVPSIDYVKGKLGSLS